MISKISSQALAGLGLIVVSTLTCATASKLKQVSLPEFLIGEFEDDYGVRYRVDNELIRLLPNDTYHIIGINKNKEYLILQNDSLNAFAPSLFSRIDYERLNDMHPYEWAFCFSNYDEPSVKDAVKNTNTQKSDLMTGCNGFPFSRMKRLEEAE
ncbi:MAG: hypothetical protein AAF741_12425 [Bacteroidota bacterium]